jgi:hypothetical protein
VVTEKKRGRPATGQKPKHGFRVADEKWEAAQKKAAAEGRTVSDVLSDCLDKYIGDDEPEDDKGK